jgi:glycerophosphoryl diester phosphodiesterase
MLIIGHRGESGVEPENTIRSLKRSEEADADMTELDIRRSKDGELVVFHDHSLKRLFGLRKSVASLTLDELKEISKNREIPTLDEVLSTIGTDLVLDVKVYGIEKQLLVKIKNFPHKVLITSWNPLVLKKIRALDRNIPLGPVFGIKGTLFLLPILIRFLRKLNIYSITIIPQFVNPATMKRFRQIGWKVLPYSINDEKEFRRLEQLGVDGVFTDYPELIKQYEQSQSI